MLQSRNFNRALRHLAKRFAIQQPASSFPFSAAVSGGGAAPKLNLNLKNLGKQLKKPVYFDQAYNNEHFDVAVIGGGSGGLGFVLEAQKLGLKVAVFDYIEPTPHGTKWGLGGTCVNVGCIPKKLMHQAAIHKENIVNSYDFGFNLGELNDPDDHVHSKLNGTLEWNRLVRNVQLHIKSINFDYVSNLKENGTAYMNCLAAFHDANTLVYTNQKGALEDYLKTDKIDSEKMGKITADHIVVAVGGRPSYLKESACTNNQKFAITSDDIFSLSQPPNKTLVVGGGYIALECAGFLSNLGFPVTLMNRTDTFLRGFDTDMSTMIVEYIKRNTAIDVMPWNLPYHIEEQNGRFLTKFRNLKNSVEGHDEFDTILLAIGRTANTRNLNLKKVGVEINEHNLKITGGYKGEFEKTSVDHIYAVGDVLDKVPELTPIAAKSASNLAHRIFLKTKGKENSAEYKHYMMDYRDFPTSVFTPLEYSCCGLPEEKAIEVFGEENIQVYHSKFTPLEEAILMRNHPEDGEPLRMKGYTKLVCNKNDDERIVGIHYAGPNSGEVMQGYAVAMKLGMRKKDLDRTVGIHPTTAEEFTVMTKTKAEDPEKTSC